MVLRHAEIIMTPKTKTSQLNLVGVVSPVCLLKCQSALNILKPGNILEVMVQDPEVVNNLQKIIERSANQVIKTERRDDYFQIVIHRGFETKKTSKSEESGIKV